MHVPQGPKDVEVTIVPWNHGDGPPPIAIITPYPNLTFQVFKAPNRDGWILRSDIGAESFIPRSSILDRTPTMQCLRAALNFRDMELFIPTVVIDDTDLFVPRILI